MTETVTFLAGARDVLLGVLGVIMVANMILDNVKEGVKAAKEVVVATGELVVAVRALFQDARWARWAENIRSDLQSIDFSVLFEFFDWHRRLGIVRMIQSIEKHGRISDNFP